MSKWHFDPQTRFVCDTRTLVLVFALRFPQEFSIKNDLDPFKRDFYWRYKCTANRGTNVPQCTAVPFKCFDPLPKIVSNTFHRFWEFVNVSWHQITLFVIFGNIWTAGQPECTAPRGTFVPLMSKWQFDPQTRFVPDTRTLVFVFALRFPRKKRFKMIIMILCVKRDLANLSERSSVPQVKYRLLELFPPSTKHCS